MKTLFSVFATLFLFIGCASVGAVIDGGKDLATSTVDTVVSTSGNVASAGLRDIANVVSTAADVTEGVVGTVVSEVDKQTDEKKSKEEQEALLRKIMDFEVKSLEEKGAVNLLVQNDTFKTLDGTETLRLFGSMDLKNGNSFDRYRFVSVVFPLDEVKISLQIIFLQNDIYGEKIEKRIFDSLEIIRKI